MAKRMAQRGCNGKGESLVCGTCGKDVLTEGDPSRKTRGIWKLNAKVYHCKGQSNAFGAQREGEVHHHPIGYWPCWNCKADLGCARCSGLAGELLCMGDLRMQEGSRFDQYLHRGLGPVWGTRLALVRHGPLVDFNQKITDYPTEWQTAYHRPGVAPGRWIPGGGGSWLITDENGVPQPARRYAAELRIEGKPIPPRPKEAEGFQLFNETQEKLFAAGSAGAFQNLTLGQMVRKLSDMLDMNKKRG